MSETLHYALFFVGVFLLIGGVVLGVGAFEYEVKLLDTVEEVPEGVEAFAQYDSLGDRDRAMVDRAIAGERVVVRGPDELPGTPERRGKLAVQRDDQYYVLSRRIFFNWRTTFGIASLALGVAGLAALSESIRRHHFPHRPVYWVRH